MIAAIQSHTYTSPKTVVNVCNRIMTKSSIYEIIDDESKRVCKRTYIQCNHEMTCRDLNYSLRAKKDCMKTE